MSARTQFFRCVPLVAWIAPLLLFSCADPSTSVLMDPDGVGTDQGTLVSLSDIRSVATQMIQSMSASSQLGELRLRQKPLRIAVGDIKNRTSIAIFDKQLFVNRLLASLSSADVNRAYSFLRRDPESAGNEAPGTFVGADLVLGGEIREILHREPSSGGGELERRSVQYALTLTRVADAAVLWAEAREIVKQQITGAIYR